MWRVGVGLAVLGFFLLAGCANTPKQRDAQASAPASAAVQTECDGLAVTTQEQFYPGGALFRQRQVVQWEGEDVLHGVMIEKYENGQTKLELHYRCGAMHGPRKTWYENGNPWAMGENVDGRGHGTWTVWYPDGTKAQEFAMDHGVWTGPYVTWHPNGQMRSEVEYLNGLRQGAMNIYDEEGNLIQQTEFADGRHQPSP